MTKAEIIEVLKKYQDTYYEIGCITKDKFEKIADELQTKELTDEEIEKAFPTSDINCGDIGKELHASINIAKQKGAEWYRKQLKQL